MARVLKFDDVSVTRGNRQIIKHLSWEVNTGENWAILG